MNILKIDERLENIERLLLTNGSHSFFEERCTYTGFKSSYLYKLTSSNKRISVFTFYFHLFFDKKKLDNWLLSNYQNFSWIEDTKTKSSTLKNKR